MEYTYPSYYFDFKCTADQCIDTCCAGWEIMIDPVSMKKYKHYQAPYGKKLRKEINQRRGSFKQYQRRCAFLNEKNLCDMYTNAGEGMLCATCRRYPRHAEAFENVREYSIGLSCPVAAELILSQEKLVLKTREIPDKQETEEDFDELLFSQLLDAREVLFEIAERKDLTLHEIMMLMLVLGHHIQRRVSDYAVFGMEEIYLPYLKESAGEKIHTKAQSQMSEEKAVRLSEDLFAMLYKMEKLMPSWPAWMDHCANVLFSSGEKGFEELMRFEVSEQILRQVLTYFLYTYFTGAIYDGRPYAKIKFAVVSTLYIEMMLKVLSWENEGLTMEDYVDIAHRYAREVEHSDINVKRMEKLILSQDCFDIANLLKILEVTGR